ncbi:3-hydroxyacyl-CoA dehydrogenase family protein [Microbacterium sp.]|uniref:3-hydroxyacyl-CoA dehydrogenase family protein n=1 Tax=Microbacterium sp. TaxID=51671 RepID=UPI00262680B3|nr:3-hydroxyacyl-CoA dehydrogenase family protein [Microbacterium sp.]
MQHELSASTHVAVIGIGEMGLGIALLLASSGHEVIAFEKDPVRRAALPHEFKRQLRRQRMLAGESGVPQADLIGRIRVPDEVEAVRDADWIIDCIVENEDAKIALADALSDIVRPDAVIAVNTSCVPITRLAARATDPTRVIGMHFMNPVASIDAVEVIPAVQTSVDTEEQAAAFLTSLGKNALFVSDSPGFVSNRLSHLLMNEAAMLVSEGVAEPGRIDSIFRDGYGHRMGPLETADLIGLDTVVNSLDVLFAEFKDTKFRCSPYLRRLVDAGYLGRKSGRGFYDYSSKTTTRVASA